jgi:hypothetical protein
MSDSDRWLYRLGSTAAVVGSVLGMIGNLLHPQTPIGDPEGVARVIAQSGSTWITIHVVIVFGVLLMLGGLVALQHSLDDGLASALSRLGLATATVGVSLGVVLVILDGVAAPQLAEAWAAAPAEEREATLHLVTVNETLDFALASAFNFVFAGATFILFGLAVARATAYPRWLGWIAAAAGLMSLVAGSIQAYAGESTEESQILTIIGPTVITGWLIAIGILMARRSWRLGPGISRDAAT